MQEKPHIVLPVIVVAVRNILQTQTHFIDQSLVLQGVGDDCHLLRECLLLQNGPVPGENQRGVFLLFLLHGVRQPAQDAVLPSGLLLHEPQILQENGLSASTTPDYGSAGRTTDMQATGRMPERMRYGRKMTACGL